MLAASGVLECEAYMVKKIRCLFLGDCHITPVEVGCSALAERAFDPSPKG